MPKVNGGYLIIIYLLEIQFSILFVEAATKENPGSVKFLESKCMQFQKQIYEMEASTIAVFL